MELAIGFEHYHVFARAKNNRFNTSTEGNITLHLIPKIINRSAIFVFSSFYLLFIIKKYKITHLLAQSSIHGGVAAAVASQIFKIPLMTEIHGEEYFRFLKKDSLKNKALAKIIDFTFKRSAKIRSLNRLMTAKLNTAGYSQNIVEIPNRVNLSVFTRKKENFEIGNMVKITSVGRFVKEKNYLQLITNLHQANINFHLTLIGGGLLKPGYMEYIATNGLQDSVTLIDWVDQRNLIDTIIASDIYIQYSISEGMPRTIVEAMALQMPIITTNVGSILGVIKDMNNGLVLSDFSVNELSAAISWLKNNASGAVIAKNAFNDVKEKYEWNKVFEIYRNELLNMHCS
ncbi:hypothetical protein RG47T_3929 [Mucilaginibacter polytrichastri]|uniref:Glycosyl transferase family 1 domain-containing protein n=1 Tax=Mucilaginibacter polytrichastri TaxID=1302689 RepID=A0A1Q6A3B0_9SPHI|nr:hypothetical protein RG47T_3929 [Mucilaginibacter polytrichastri]